MSDLATIAAYRPADVDEALDAMRDALAYFHRQNDHRAVFARAYYLITIAVHQAINGRGPYTNRIFFDPPWVARLAGKFSSLYFRSLTTAERPGERAWKTAHRLAASREASVMQDMLLGINAHINYDLAYGIYLNLKEFDDGRDHLLLPRRKFDHDQVNNVLINSVPVIEETLTRDYGGEMLALGQLAGDLDDVLGGVGLKYYRERVWWNAIAYLSTTSEAEVQLVHDRLDWESAQLAESLACENTFLRRSLRQFLNVFSKNDFSAIVLEGADAGRPKRRPEQATPPFLERPCRPPERATSPLCERPCRPPPTGPRRPFSSGAAQPPSRPRRPFSSGAAQPPSRPRRPFSSGAAAGPPRGCRCRAREPAALSRRA